MEGGRAETDGRLFPFFLYNDFYERDTTMNFFISVPKGRRFGMECELGGVGGTAGEMACLSTGLSTGESDHCLYKGTKLWGETQLYYTYHVLLTPHIPHTG
ncbi:hypothetical protein B0H67DRAFT_593995 [Lasiosphaeris hirsuta]|uniref:Uncharacterized protein n=1 Tax=Lasiosphaeris hirsuta TaxID=260670 RepID=A0AA40DJG4_9PEZI|nr:hypothetical protein B0H67DRAFT_593995 [Lasiosphaeris hirsuta]